jgi:hypothetical protein
VTNKDFHRSIEELLDDIFPTESGSSYEPVTLEGLGKFWLLFQSRIHVALESVETEMRSGWR